MASHAEFTSHALVDFPEVTWWKHPGLWKLYIMTPILFLGSPTNGYDGLLTNGLQTMNPWEDHFNNPSGSTLGVFTANQNIGASYTADIFGRKKGVAIGLVILFVGTVIQVVPCVNSNMFLAGRFLVGLGSNISQASAPLLITELAHPQHRGKLTTMYNTLWYVGAIVAAWTVFGTIEYTSKYQILPDIVLKKPNPCIRKKKK